MDKLFSKRYLRYTMKALSDKFNAIFMIYGDDNTYELIKGDDFFYQTVGEKGSIQDLYHALFFHIRLSDEDIHDNYSAFAKENTNLLKLDNYSSHITLVQDGTSVDYSFRVFEIENNVFGLYFLQETSIQNEKNILKLDSLQQNYLFSMIVDLNEDICSSSNVTELTGNDMNNLSLPYSRWRESMLPMFMEEDQKKFFSITDPKFVISALEKQTSARYEFLMQNLIGEYIWVRLCFTRTKAFSRKNPVFVYTVEDIHDDMIRLLQQENIVNAIEAKNKELKDDNEKISSLISHLSHELRTPLNAVLGMDQIILRESNNDQVIHYAKDIQTAGNLLLSMINDILDFSRLTAGKMEIFQSPYSPRETIHDVTNIIAIKAQEKKLDFMVSIDPELPANLLGDDIRLKQILINLLGNAIKYTQEGSVSLSVNFQKESDAFGFLNISIKDTGVGISAEDIERLFSPFERIDEAKNRNVEGTGLGMSIVKALLLQMGSELAVESELGVGSTFSFTLRQEIVASKIEETVSSDSALDSWNYPDIRLLVVDDVQTNLAVIKGMLQHTGIQVDFAFSGEECLSKLKENTYDAILLDHLMPEMDGIETLSNIRKMGDWYANVPVIAMTAYVSSGSKDYYIKEGFTDYLGKPVSIHRLEKVLRRALHV